MNKQYRGIILIALIVFAVIMVMNGQFSGSMALGQTKPKELTAQQFNAMVKDGQVKSADWQQSYIRGDLVSGEKYQVYVFDVNSPSAAPLIEEMLKHNVNLDYKQPPVFQSIMGAVGFILPFLLILGIFYFLFIRSAQMGGNQAMNFGRSRAKRAGETGPKVTFEDVAGIDEAKEELYEIVDFLKNTKRYTALGAKIPKGILLMGPPGVGKTHIARAVAGEAGVPFFHISGSDFVEMFVGVGAARVRDLFETAKAHRPSLIFLDEIDAVGRQRGAGLGGGHDEREQTLNQLLVEMDGFDPNSGVILIAATNRPDVLDPALLRPGRFDRQIVVEAPDQPGREKILNIHAKGKPMDSDVDLATIAKRTPGFTGADLANTLNEAALLAARNGHAKIMQRDIEEALDRVIAGPQRKSRVIDGREREIIAYHEAGHAVIGETLEHCDPVHKVTILPRGMSLGSTWHLPVQDKFLVSQQELLDDITALLGGRVAEEIVYGEVWTGASNDLERVTRIARAMVCEYGMSEKLGTLALGRRSNNPFLGRDYHDERNYSEDVARQIDEEVRGIVEHCHARAKQILMEKRPLLDRLVQELLVHETLNREEFLMVMEGKPLPKPDKPTLPSGPIGAAEPNAGSDKNSPQYQPPRLEPGPASG